jgi:hypothetical protein
MTAPPLRQTEWRVCAQALEGEWLGWRVTVYCRATTVGEEPGGWRLVRDVTYKCPKGQVRNDYWKAILKEAAR